MLTVRGGEGVSSLFLVLSHRPQLLRYLNHSLGEREKIPFEREIYTYVYVVPKGYRLGSAPDRHSHSKCYDHKLKMISHPCRLKLSG